MNDILRRGRSALDRCALFMPLDADARSQLAFHIRLQTFAAGETIFHFGSPGQSMLIVLSGIVRISIPSTQGKQVVVTDLHSGDVFGEIALFDGGQRSADASALTNCELATLERRDILPILARNPKACLQLLKLICGRLRRTDELMIDLLFLDLSARLAKALLSRASTARGQSGGKLGLSQRELGNLVGGRRESVNRCLQAWQRLGIIRLNRGWIQIVKPGRLHEIAEVESAS